LLTRPSTEIDEISLKPFFLTISIISKNLWAIPSRTALIISSPVVLNDNPKKAPLVSDFQ